MAKKRAVKDKAPDASAPVCEVCGKRPAEGGHLMQLELPDGRKSPNVCLSCFERAGQNAKQAAAQAAVCAACGKKQPPGVVLYQPGDLCARCYRHAEEAVKGRQPLPKLPAAPGHIPDDLAGEIFAHLDEVKVRRIEFDAATEHRKALKASLEEAQGELEQVLDDARSGQTRLFEAKPEAPDRSGDAGQARAS